MQYQNHGTAWRNKNRLELGARQTRVNVLIMSVATCTMMLCSDVHHFLIPGMKLGAKLCQVTF